MTSNQAFHAFCAFAAASLAGLFRLLGIFEMEFTETVVLLVKTTLLTFSFIASCCLFGKLLETILKKSS